jgi:hypothetical protein
MSFPSIVDGKPLNSHRDEKLEFRFILNQQLRPHYCEFDGPF